MGDILYRSEANSDASQDGPRSEREDSDYDEELELDFETSISGDEGHDVESNILHGSLNLRFHRRGDSTRENIANGSCGSQSSSAQNDRAAYQVHIWIFTIVCKFLTGEVASFWLLYPGQISDLLIASTCAF